MIGFDIRKRRGEAEPDPGAAKAVCARALDMGLVVLTCGPQSESVRVLVPLTASDAIIDEGMDYLEAALSAVE
jgi:4-aminobutyrate aminotransferase/(S)-3-amino-2-methylpropionate transaminase